MTDKTSTAPVMSRKDDIVRNLCRLMNSLGLAWAKDPEARTDDSAEASQNLINYVLGLSAPTPDVVGGDVVATCYVRAIALHRLRENGHIWEGNYATTLTLSPKDADDVALYATPCVQGDIDYEGLQARIMGLVAEAWVHGKDEGTLGDEVKRIVAGLAAQPKGDLLDAPALVGNTIFDRGTKCSNVIARAQLAYKHKDDVMPPEQITEMRAALDRARGTQAPIAASHPAEQTRGDGVACPECFGMAVMDHDSVACKQCEKIWPLSQHETYLVETVRKHIEAATLDHCKGGDLYLSTWIAAKKIACVAAPRQAVPDGWQTIKTAPIDGVLHARGLHVKTNRGWYFDVVAGYVDELGQFADLNGDITRWSTDDYEYWHPLTAAPSAGLEGGEG